MRKCVFPQWRSPFQTHKKWFQNCFQTHFWIARSVCCFTIQVQVPHFVHEMKWTKIVNCLSSETNLLEKFLFAVAFVLFLKMGYAGLLFISFLFNHFYAIIVVDLDQRACWPLGYHQDQRLHWYLKYLEMASIQGIAFKTILCLNLMSTAWL